MKLQYLLLFIIFFTLPTVKVSGQTYDGFAKGKKGGIYFLIDSSGHEYKLATRVEQLDPSITALDLQGKKLKEIPKGVFLHRQLKVLLLNFNQLTTLPPEIGNLTNLTYLSLDGNKLMTLPPDIRKLINLTSLDLDNIQLTTLPPEFGDRKSVV